MTTNFKLKHDLLTVIGLTVAAGIAIRAPAPCVCNIVLGLAYVLFCPGYAMVAALFPRRRQLDWLERLGFALATSIATVPLVAFALNFTPWGITLDSVLVSLTLFILLACGIAWYRRSRLSPDDRFAVHISFTLPTLGTMSPLDKSLTGLLGLSVAAAAGAALAFAAHPGPPEPFTEFYILGPDANLGISPTRVIPGSPIRATISIVNHEHTEVRYRLTRDVNGQHNEEIAQIHLAHDEEWELPITFSLDQPGEDQKVSFLLYREGQEEPYRSLHLWIDVLPEGESPTSGS